MKEKKFRRRKKNAIPLVLPIGEISLRPELSSPARFRFQGGSPKRYKQTTEERKSSSLILYNVQIISRKKYNNCVNVMFCVGLFKAVDLVEGGFFFYQQSYPV